MKSAQNPLLIINYHYIRDRHQYAYPGIHPIDRKAFEGQIRFLKIRYHLASPDEVEQFAHGRDGLPRPSVFLTFDDGLIDHALIAKEFLREERIKAAFFVSSRPLVEQRALPVHKIHWLRAKTRPEQFHEEFVALLPDAWRAMESDEDATKMALRINPYDSPEIARLKYLINFRLPNDLVDEVTTELLRSRGISEASFCKRLYLGKDHIMDLTREGHLVGNHGHGHIPLGITDRGLIAKELETTNSCLRSITGLAPRWVSYPYGVAPPDADAVCHDLGFAVGLGLTRGWNTGIESPYRLNRINPNDIDAVIRGS